MILRVLRPCTHAADLLAINAGDAVHALVGRRLAELPVSAANTVAIARDFGTTLQCMVEGQARDLAWSEGAPNARPTATDYLHMIRGKTGALFGLAASVTAHLACSSAVAPLHSFGIDLGVAFQIADDLLDVCADAIQIGKPVKGIAPRGIGALLGCDDVRRDATLILALAARSSARRPRARSAISTGSMPRCRCRSPISLKRRSSYYCRGASLIVRGPCRN